MVVHRGTISPVHPALVLVVGLLFVTQYLFAYVAESVGTIVALASGLVIYGLLSSLNVSERLSKAIEDVSLLLIYIMLISALPWFFFRQELLVPAVYSIVLALCFWRIYRRNLSLEYLGLVGRSIRTNSLIGIAAGIPMGVIEYFILRPQRVTPTFDHLYFLQTTVYMLVFVALGEEILFRALIQKSVVNAVGVIPGILWSGVIFALMHFVWRSVPELFFTFGAGLLLGIFYQRSGSLVGPIIVHGTNNLMLLAVMPYLAA